jgi:threonyl-tRNA synthetase
VFGIDVRLELSTRPEERIGSDELWDLSEAALTNALESQGLEYDLNEGDGAFYGPKIDGQVKDAIGRWHQLSTIQLDFGLPKRFDLGYTAQNGAEARPVMVHRAVLGSLERFIGILIEHTAGDFPLWLAPVQVGVVTINDRLLGYGRKVQQAFEQAGLRATLDTRSEKLGAKIRELELGKVPIIAVVGQKEADANTVSLRWRKKGDQGALVLDQAVGDVLMAATVPSPGAPLVRRMAQAWEQNFLPQDP